MACCRARRDSPAAQCAAQRIAERAVEPIERGDAFLFTEPKGSLLIGRIFRDIGVDALASTVFVHQLTGRTVAAGEQPATDERIALRAQIGRAYSMAHTARQPRHEMVLI